MRTRSIAIEILAMMEHTIPGVNDIHILVTAMRTQKRTPTTIRARLTNSLLSLDVEGAFFCLDMMYRETNISIGWDKRS